MIWVDVDGDDDLDLFVTQRLAPNKLWIRNAEGMLVEVPNAGGLAGGSNERTYGTSWGDYDRDGDLDVYCCKFHAAPVNTESNRLFQNLGGVDLNVNFSDVTETAGVGNGVKQTFQSSWIDLNDDGWLDLHVINDRTVFKDALYLNLQDGTFEDISVEIGLDLGIYSMSSSFADYDKDLDWDVFISNGATSQNRLMNCMSSLEGTDDDLGLSYQNVANQAGVVLDELAWAGLWMDADNNGWQDLLITTGTSFPTEYPQILDLHSAQPSSRPGLHHHLKGDMSIITKGVDAHLAVQISVALHLSGHPCLALQQDKGIEWRGAAAGRNSLFRHAPFPLPRQRRQMVPPWHAQNSLRGLQSQSGGQPRLPSLDIPAVLLHHRRVDAPIGSPYQWCGGFLR